jgi:hypothetical protein
MPVSSGTGISFSDYHFMQTRTRKQSGERRLPTPSWAFNLSEQRELLARFWELRAGIMFPRIDTPAKRIRYAHRRYLRHRVPRLRETLKKLCHERLASDDPKRRRQLEIEIRGIDTQLRIVERGPALVVGIIHNFYAVGLDSPGTGAELGVHPVSVRQTLNRLHKTWRAMVDGTDRKPTPEEVRKAKIRVKSRRWRAENPEKYRESREKVKAWRRANPEKFRDQWRRNAERDRELHLLDKRVNRRRNPERERERARRWAEENRERRQAYKKAWNERNKERIREDSHQYYLAHRKMVLERQKAARRAKKALAGSAGPR